MINDLFSLNVQVLIAFSLTVIAFVLVYKFLYKERLPGKKSG